MNTKAHDAAAIELLVAHRRYLDAAIDVLRKVPTVFERPSPLVLLALAMRLVQRGAGVHTLCVQGYAAEAGPVLRSMLSAVASITYIEQQDTDSRALTFLNDEVRISRNLLPRARDQGLLTPEEVERLLGQTETFNRERVEQFAPEGIHVDKQDRPGRTWHGYANDEQFFDAIGLKPWYDSFYSGLSEDSHGSSWSLLGDIQKLARGEFTFGPHYGNTADLRFTIAGSYSFVNRCLLVLDRGLALQQLGAITTSLERIRAALGAANARAVRT